MTKQKEAPHFDPLLNEREAADYLGWAHLTLKEKRGDGDAPPFIKLGGWSIRYRLSDLNAWIEQFRSEGGGA